MNQYTTLQNIMTMVGIKVDTYLLITNTEIDLLNLEIENVGCLLMKEIDNIETNTTLVALHQVI